MAVDLDNPLTIVKITLCVVGSVGGLVSYCSQCRTNRIVL